MAEIKPRTGAQVNSTTPMPVKDGILTKTQGDGYGSQPNSPMPVPDGIITKTQGDGFGSQPLPTSVPSSPGLPDFGTIPGLGGVPYGTPASSPVPGVGSGTPLSPVPAATLSPNVNPINSAPTQPAPAQGSSGAVGLSPTDPNNPLTSQTITPGSLADRFKLAQDRFQTFTAASEPAYQAALRDANRFGAAAGGLGSGQLRTSLGDLALNRTRDLTNSRDNLFQNALEGSIGDTWNTIGLAERQQGFQNQQQQQAFEQALQQFYAGQAGGTGAATRTAYGSNVAGQGQDALSAVNQWARNYVPPAPQRPTTPPFNPSAPQGGF
jgi:hypothetical protein